MRIMDLDSSMGAVPDVSNGFSAPPDQTSNVYHRQQQAVTNLNVLLS